MPLSRDSAASSMELEKTATADRRVAPPSGEELPAGMRLGHFQLVKKLGAGGMGEVYLATDLALDRPVAIKVLPSTATSAGAARERLIREARAQARIHHPNVAHIYFIGEDAGRLYFAMEYVTGAALADAKSPFPVEDALRIIHDAALGLREAQRSGFTHRDVKPSNLMVDGHGSVKVLDFGIAAGGAAEVGDGPVAQTTLAGTPLYMAPEQARGEPIDFRADIYALGATLYQLVSGKPPFQADTVAQLITLHQNAARPAVPRGIVPRTQGTALDALIARMMAPTPADRFASYDELLRAIENVSTQYTRPGGFVARIIATGMDALVMLIFIGLVSVLMPADRRMPQNSIGLPVLAGIEVLLIGRFGTTSGLALFELEVASVVTGTRATWRQALRRTLLLFGPLIVIAWIAEVLELVEARDVFQEAIAVLFGVVVLLNIVHLAYSSLRTAGKRTWWDRRAGTIVRYRR